MNRLDVRFVDACFSFLVRLFSSSSYTWLFGGLSGVEAVYEDAQATAEVTLASWLVSSAKLARERAAVAEKTLAEAESLRLELVRTLGLSDIGWSREWSAIYRRAVLLSFKALYRDHGREIEDHLSGVHVIFGSETGLTRNGDLLLNSGEVRNNWLKVPFRCGIPSLLL